MASLARLELGLELERFWRAEARERADHAPWLDRPWIAYGRFVLYLRRQLEVHVDALTDKEINVLLSKSGVSLGEFCTMTDAAAYNVQREEKRISRLDAPPSPHRGGGGTEPAWVRDPIGREVRP